MRLERIKLAGFKSFVDPTVIELRSNLVGIVGPNGCGKSNIIDAVRWVMGESSAKTLRGESMEDVIFNGAAGRKPVGQAAVELLFNNSDGSLGGEYAKYTQISIRREVSRDGQSHYYLNGGRCRRRDIKDIFLGTGLLRGYAIIQQGMVSRIVEAKPGEMRSLVEEAAGIALYKDRKHETENRMRHTRENLSRVNDIREELEKQLSRLKRQSQAAARYKALKDEQRQLQAQLHALKWQAIDNALQAKKSEMQKEEVDLESAIAVLRKCDNELELLREKQIELNEAFNQVQKEYYEIGSQIVSFEQSLQHGRERCQSISQDLAQTQAALASTKADQVADNDKRASLEEEIAQLTPELEQANGLTDHALTQLQTAEQAMQQWQARWDSFNTEAASISEKAQVEKTRIQQLEQRIEEALKRLAVIKTEQAQLDDTALQAEIDQLKAERSTKQTDIEGHQHQLANSQSTIQAQRDQNQTISTALDTLRSALQKDQGRFASLEALQQAALGQQNDPVADWLAEHDLSQLPRLAQTLRVVPGWEQAVETVLSTHLEAVCLSDLKQIETIFSKTVLPAGQLTLLHVQALSAKQATTSTLTPLIDQITTPATIAGLVDGIYVAETLPEALAARHQLTGNESIVTKAGVWISQAWVKIAKREEVRSGVIKRENDLQCLGKDISEKEQAITDKLAELTSGQAALQALEQQRDKAQQALNQSKDQLNQSQTRLKVAQTRCEQLNQRRLSLDEEYQTLLNRSEENRQALEASRAVWQKALSQMQTHADTRQTLNDERSTCQTDLETIRPQAHSTKDQLHRLTVEMTNKRSQCAALTLACDRLDKRVSELTDRQATLEANLVQVNAPLAEIQTTLNSTLTKRADVDTVLQQASARVQAVEADLREQVQTRDSVEKQIEHKRVTLEKMRIDSQADTVRRDDLKQKLTETQQTLADILDTVPEQTSIEVIDTTLSEVGQSITRLGAINLAAIEEYDVELKRKEHLDSQYIDLSEALATLESAIAKIDKETRQRFKETFDNINHHFRTLFPKLFGGGEAYLALTEEDLLTSGVTMMARPPGKRNSSIHLLSGGEKALTAISLVFAIFKLNPAPFCILDEVDAPLDDANVGRFCRLVKSIAENIQVLFISHNKVAIEMSKQLMGVTMHEPGVSRLVTVDIDEAVAIAEQSEMVV